MDAAQVEWLELRPWEQPGPLPHHPRQVQSGQVSARRRPEGQTLREAAELDESWQRYREVIAELGRTTAALEGLPGPRS